MASHPYDCANDSAMQNAMSDFFPCGDNLSTRTRSATCECQYGLCEIASANAQECKCSIKGCKLLNVSPQSSHMQRTSGAGSGELGAASTIGLVSAVSSSSNSDSDVVISSDSGRMEAAAAVGEDSGAGSSSSTRDIREQRFPLGVAHRRTSRIT